MALRPHLAAGLPFSQTRYEAGAAQCLALSKGIVPISRGRETGKQLGLGLQSSDGAGRRTRLILSQDPALVCRPSALRGLLLSPSGVVYTLGPEGRRFESARPDQE